jgi:3-oxoacyl-[acyl-carrier protein] reductase
MATVREMSGRPEARLLEGRTVLVTAAAGAGIGFATARRCAENGGRLLVSDRHEGRLEKAVDELERLTGRPPLKFLCDVTKQADVDGLFAFAELELGSVDVLVNNAGLGGQKRVVDMSDDEWLRVIDVNLTGTFRMLRAGMRHMIRNRKGAIVNLSSVLGWRAQTEQAHYAAAKAGIMALTRCAALEAAPHNVRINAVAPSLAMHPHLHQTSSTQLLDRLIAMEPMGRAADPLEVADVIVFLASDLASYMTGEVVSVSAQHP